MNFSSVPSTNYNWQTEIVDTADVSREVTHDEHQKTRSAFRALALEPVGDNFDDGIFRRLRDGHQLRRWISAAAGVAAVLGIVLLLRAPRPAPGTVGGPRTPSFAAFDIPAGAVPLGPLAAFTDIH